MSPEIIPDVSHLYGRRLCVRAGPNPTTHRTPQSQSPTVYGAAYPTTVSTPYSPTPSDVTPSDTATSEAGASVVTRSAEQTTHYQSGDAKSLIDEDQDVQFDKVCHLLISFLLAYPVIILCLEALQLKHVVKFFRIVAVLDYQGFT